LSVKSRSSSVHFGRAATRSTWWLLIACAAMSVPIGATAHAEELNAEDVLKNRGCIACHRIPGIPEATGTIGPSLQDLGSKRRIAGEKLLNTPENLRLWLKDPKSFKTTMMPTLYLTDQELDVLVKFLGNL